RILGHERAPRTEWKEFLQKNDEIKNPHAPSHGQSAENISAEHRVYRWWNLQNVLRIQKHFDEFLFVPRLNETHVNIHRVVELARVSREQAVLSLGIGQRFIENIGAHFTGHHGEENTAAENRIDKAGGVSS